MYYIQEADKPNFILGLFTVIQLQQDKIILPICKEQGISAKKAQKLAKKTKKVFEQAISKKIVLSEKIRTQEEYVNLLHSYDLEIVEGKWLFEVLTNKILEKILEREKRKKQDIKLSILVNDVSEIMLVNIRKLAKEYKSMNIVTNHIQKFKKLEKQILEEDGIMITVGNNKRKGISNAEMILNVDFPEELVNQYHIYENAVIVNVRENVKIAKKRFNGICINDYDISYQKPEEFDYDKETKYKACKIYESQINQKQPVLEIMKQIEKDKVQITKLLGVNGEI